MSSRTNADEGRVRTAIRTVTPPYHGRPDREMTILGLAYFAGLVILLIPLLPFIVLLWLVGKVLDMVSGSRSSE